MGLFGFGKKKEEPRKSLQEEALDGLVRFHTENGDIASAFYFANKATVDFMDDEFWARWRRSGELTDDSAKIQAMRTAEASLYSMRKFCSEHEGGLQYFDEHYTKFMEMVQNGIQRTEYHMNKLPAEIISRVAGGIAQADLIRSFDPSQKFVVQDAIDRLAVQGKIRKEKVGNRWMLSVPK